MRALGTGIVCLGAYLLTSAAFAPQFAATSAVIFGIHLVIRYSNSKVVPFPLKLSKMRQHRVKKRIFCLSSQEIISWDHDCKDV